MIDSDDPKITKKWMMMQFVVKPALPALLCIIGFAVGGLLGLLDPAFGVGWGGIFGAVIGGVVGKILQTMLSRLGV